MYNSLAMISKSFSYLKFAFKNFRNPFIIFKLLINSSQQRNYTVTLKKGIKLSLRPSRQVTVCDLDILEENLNQDQYNLVKLIKKGDTIVDIGAHIGIFSIMAAKISEYGQVFSFEPEESNYLLLQKNISLNKLKNLRFFNKAVTSKGGKVKLVISPNNKGAHTLLGQGDQFQEVSAVTLTEIINFIGGNNINLLKLDCEGSEYDILLNAEPKDLRRIDKIIMEVHETPYTGNYNAKLLYQHLTMHGFTIQVIKTIVYPTEGVFYIINAKRGSVVF